MDFANAKKQKRSRDKGSAPAKQADQQKGNVTDAVLADALEPLLQALFLEGHTHVAAASPVTVAKLTCQLERLLVAYGIVPQTKRAEDPHAYVRSLQRVEDREFRKELIARCATLRETGRLPTASIPDAETIVEPVLG